MEHAAAQRRWPRRTGRGRARAEAGGRGGGGGLGGEGWGVNFTNDLLKDIIPYHRIALFDVHRRRSSRSGGPVDGRHANPTIAPANLDKFSYIGVFSGGNIMPENITDKDAFKKQVKVVFMSFGSRESSTPTRRRHGPSGPDGIKLAADALGKEGINAVYYVSPDSAHDFTSWKRSLYYFAPMLFQTQSSP